MIVEKREVKPANGKRATGNARKYYVVECNDGCELSKELSTLREARRELKKIIKEDARIFEVSIEEVQNINSYYITKYIETEDTLYYEEVK